MRKRKQRKSMRSSIVKINQLVRSQWVTQQGSASPIMNQLCLFASVYPNVVVHDAYAISKDM